MRYSDRFLELPQIVYDEEADEFVQTVVKFDVNQIALYEIYLDEHSEPTGTRVLLRSGESFMVMLALDKFEEHLNHHWSILCSQ